MKQTPMVEVHISPASPLATARAHAPSSVPPPQDFGAGQHLRRYPRPVPGGFLPCSHALPSNTAAWFVCCADSDGGPFFRTCCACSTWVARRAPTTPTCSWETTSTAGRALWSASAFCSRISSSGRTSSSSCAATTRVRALTGARMSTRCCLHTALTPPALPPSLRRLPISQGVRVLRRVQAAV
jgi:hypothetical protein